MNTEHQTKTDKVPPGPAANHDRGGSSISDLVGSLATDLSTLLRKEVALAKSEVRESVTEVKTAAGAMATGAVIALAGLFVLLMSGVYLLGTIVALWLAALIVGAAALVIGYLMVASAKKKMSADSLAPDRTMDAVKKDTETAKRTTH